MLANDYVELDGANTGATANNQATAPLGVIKVKKSMNCKVYFLGSFDADVAGEIYIGANTINVLGTTMTNSQTSYEPYQLNEGDVVYTKVANGKSDGAIVFVKS